MAWKTFLQTYLLNSASLLICMSSTRKQCCPILPQSTRRQRAVTFVYMYCSRIIYPRLMTDVVLGIPPKQSHYIRVPFFIFTGSCCYKLSDNPRSGAGTGQFLDSPGKFSVILLDFHWQYTLSNVRFTVFCRFHINFFPLAFSVL